ncbi:hypothetical protein PBRA_009618, partial [Plasmodiophora brassicae]
KRQPQRALLCRAWTWTFSRCASSVFQCVPTRGGAKVPSPLGDQALHGQMPFQVLHMDYLNVEPVRGTDRSYKYILVMKDDFSGLVRLIPCAEATSRAAAEALSQLIADFKPPQYLVTDGKRWTPIYRRVHQRAHDPAAIRGASHDNAGVPPMGKRYCTGTRQPHNS